MSNNTNTSSSPQFPKASHAADACPDIPNGAHSPAVSRPTIEMTEDPDDVIPPTHDDRTLVLCFDGTGDQFDGDNSNIVQFFSMLKKDDPSEQMVYYQAGIGTYTIPQIATPFYAKLSKTIDAMVGSNLDVHVMDEAGDRICLFGFSRGAYIARALTGMLHKVGLLPPCNHQQVPFAYKMYSKDDGEGWKQSKAFKRAFSIDVDVQFVGVWDTVNSVGIIPYRLPFTKANNKIRYFRHALALDEHRARFMPNFCNRSTDADNKLGVQKGEMPRSTKKSRPVRTPYDKLLHEGKRRYTESISQTDADEVWFAGCHCDVGGGSVENGTRHSLARIPLRWMIREIFKTKHVGMDPSTLYLHVTPRPPAIFNRPLLPAKIDSGTPISNDALSPMYDQLEIAPYWWILEMLPQKQRYQREDDTWIGDVKVNMGGGRDIPKRRTLKIHRTVKIRMEADTLKEGKYWPKAKINVEPTWVD
ncbi:hypothetical protein F5J12DRAFT_904840 [Pisolithus orientalis]|uniref:uncharacterized protein n=1 Tax=Pisolithus orientalis TaxID=936130 RepID=UPI0022256DE0|nr:uncharacterized protein F5J12DRAFT_904840 [Pisolithus orientalis]KAI6012771.1 hypothetical protein F5J12DRAFT_904840 [Pisolithus orientalis]